jgi:hypothetical protein
VEEEEEEEKKKRRRKRKSGGRGLGRVGRLLKMRNSTTTVNGIEH